MSFLIAILVPAILATLYVIFAGGIHKICKILFALFVAARLHNDLPLVASGAVDYILWALILLAVSFLFFWLPRTGRCIDYGCGFFFVAMVSVVIGELLISWLTPDVTRNLWHYLCMFGISAIGSGVICLGLGKTEDFSNKIFRGIDRVLASGVMGFVFSYMGTQIFSYNEGTALFWIILVILAAVWYAVDIFVFPHFIKICAEVAAEAAAEEAAKAEKAERYAMEGRAGSEDKLDAKRRRQEARYEAWEERQRRSDEKERDRRLMDLIARDKEQERQDLNNRRFFEGW